MKYLYLLTFLLALFFAAAHKPSPKCPCQCKTTREGRMNQRKKCRSERLMAYCEMLKCTRGKKIGRVCCDKMTMTKMTPSPKPMMASPSPMKMKM